MKGEVIPSETTVPEQELVESFATANNEEKKANELKNARDYSMNLPVFT